MRRIMILSSKLTPDVLKALTGLAGKAGFSAKEVEIVTSIGEPDPDCDDEIVLVLTTPEVCADAELEKQLAAMQQGGRRAICVWPENAGADAEPPIAAQKYAYSVVSWNADKLRAVAADDDFMCFEKPDGQPLPKAHTERNLCVDEKAKPA